MTGPDDWTILSYSETPNSARPLEAPREAQACIVRFGADVVEDYGLDLLAYLQSLGRARQLSGFERQTLAFVQSGTSDMAMAGEPSGRATPPTVPIVVTGGYIVGDRGTTEG
jgi:hypothetical protein